MSKKHRKNNPDTNSTKQKIIAEKKSATRDRTPIKISLLNLMPLSFAMIIFILLWFNPFQVNVKDPWFKGAVLIDSANKVTDKMEQNRLFDEAGKILSKQVQQHPYHARVHYLYGFYWFARQNWDSAIFQQKEAIRIGAGGIVNNVEYNAQEMLNAALGNKVIPLINRNNLNEAASILENAKTANLYNPGIDKYMGIIYSRQGNVDSSLTCYLRYNKSNPNDANNLTNIAIAYNQKNMRDSARVYINQALKLEPNNATAQSLNSQLYNQ